AGRCRLDLFSKSSGLPQPSTSRPTDSISAHNELRNWSSSSMTYTREIITQPKRNYPSLNPNTTIREIITQPKRNYPSLNSNTTQLPVRSLNATLPVAELSPCRYRSCAGDKIRARDATE